jgi:hypothetical protein
MMSPSEEALLFNALDIVVFERLVDGSLILTGRAPGWFERICPNGRFAPSECLAPGPR